MARIGDARARKRLGELLTLRRVELDPRYRNRSLFAKEREINLRLAQDIENAARDNFDAPTRAFIALKYGWTADSVDRVLAGGDPVPVERASSRGTDTAQEQMITAAAEEIRRRLAAPPDRSISRDEDEDQAPDGTNGR